VESEADTRRLAHLRSRHDHGPSSRTGRSHPYLSSGMPCASAWYGRSAVRTRVPRYRSAAADRALSGGLWDIRPAEGRRTVPTNATGRRRRPRTLPVAAISRNRPPSARSRDRLAGVSERAARFSGKVLLIAIAAGGAAQLPPLPDRGRESRDASSRAPRSWPDRRGAFPGLRPPARAARPMPGRLRRGPVPASPRRWSAHSRPRRTPNAGLPANRPERRHPRSEGGSG
jgi:hypothetical protein